MNFGEKIHAFIKLQTEYYGNYSLNLLFDAIEADPVIRDYFDDYNRRSRQFAMNFIDEGKQAGFFSQDISHEAIEIYIDSFQFYFLHNTEIRKKLEHNQRLAEELNILFLDGLIQQR
jgi:hypothetical protein